jgi:hypothetical protein
MSKNTKSNKFRNFDVDQYDEDKYQDDQTDEQEDDGPSEGEVNSLLSQYPFTFTTFSYD